MTVGHSRPKVNFDEPVSHAERATFPELKSELVGGEKTKAPETCVSGAMGPKNYFERFFGLCLVKTASNCLASAVGGTAPPSTIDFAEIFFP